MAIVKKEPNKLFGLRPLTIIDDGLDRGYTGEPFEVSLSYSDILENLNEMRATPKVHNKYHGTAPLNSVYVGRGSPWGNPYVIGKDGTREEVIEKYRKYVLPKLDLAPLKGKHLVCFCKPAKCHADLLLEAANCEEVK